MTTEDSGARDELHIRVHRPLIWWRATTDHIADRLQDPDRGNIPRWPSYNQDWKAVGSAVNAVAEAIAAGKYSLDPEQPGIGVVHIPDTGLGGTEQQIVHSWFRSSAAVTTDPWTDEWSDGRHRTLHTARASPGIALPVRGDSIGFANPYDIPHLGHHWEKLYQHDLERLAALTWFDRSDALNAQFTRTLQIAAAGQIPPLVLNPGHHRQATLSPELETMRKTMDSSFPQPASTIQQQLPRPDSQLGHALPQARNANHHQDKSFGR